MKQRIRIVLFLILVFLGIAYLYHERPEIFEDLRPSPYALDIVYASDMHYLSQQLTDNGERFQEFSLSKGPKVMVYIDEIMEAFCDRMEKEQPDLVILGGDLTFFAEYLSHLDLIEKLERIEDTGIPVIVIPGNHDVGYYEARSYSDEDGFERTEEADPEDFRELYDRFGPESALSVCDDSFSYLYEVNEELAVLSIDANAQEEEDRISEETLSWAEEALELAEEEDRTVIAVLHEPLFVHDGDDEALSVTDRAEELQELFSEYGVQTVFSGHLHYQSRREEDGITEYVTSSLAIYPHYYGQIRYDRGRVSYRYTRLNVSEWAAEQGLENEDLLHFDEYSRGVTRKWWEQR